MAMALTKVTSDPTQVRLYHITHLDNLTSIVASDAILPFNQLKRTSITPRSIAYSHLQDRRASIVVPVPPGGELHDYVPWSFAARSPMLYTAQRGALGRGIVQSDIVHFVSDVRRVLQLQLSCVFTDGHPLSTGLSRYFNALDGLTACLDWGVLCGQIWSNTEDDGDRKRRRQAEFLIHGAAPWAMVRGIAVQNQTVADRVASLVQGNSYRPKVVVLPEWYY